MALEGNNKTEVEKEVAVNGLEEDEDFEEFPIEEGTTNEEEEKFEKVWEDDWDDDNVEDDFVQQLREELVKQNVTPSF